MIIRERSKNMNSKIKFVAIYIGKSRADSQEDLNKHRTILIGLCEKHRYKYIEYAEVGTSDSIDTRSNKIPNGMTKLHYLLIEMVVFLFPFHNPLTLIILKPFISSSTPSKSKR
jgi:archaellin